jgi:hypothetical protein
MNLRTLNTALLNTGGFSYSLTFGDMTGTANYSVACNKTSENVFESLPTEKQYQEYIDKHIELLSQGNIILGAWEHKGKYYLDLAQLLDKSRNTRNVAIRVGQARNQIAIFDLESMEEIRCNHKKS